MYMKASSSRFWVLRAAEKPRFCGSLLALTEPTKGVIYKDGRDITRTRPSQRGMGIVFQNYALFENMTVLQNVEYALRFHDRFRSGSRTIAESLLKGGSPRTCCQASAAASVGSNNE